MTRKEYSKLRNAFTTEAELKSCILENATVSPDGTAIDASVQLNCSDVEGIQDFLSRNSVFAVPLEVYAAAYGKLPTKLRLRMDTKAEDGLTQTATYDLLSFKGGEHALVEPIFADVIGEGVKPTSFFLFASAYTLSAPVRMVKVGESKDFVQKVKDALVAEKEVNKFIAAAIENVHGDGETRYSVHTKTEKGVTEVWVESGDKKFYRKFDYGTETPESYENAKVPETPPEETEVLEEPEEHEVLEEPETAESAETSPNELYAAKTAEQTLRDSVHRLHDALMDFLKAL